MSTATLADLQRLCDERGAELDRWHTEFGNDVEQSAKEFDQMQAELERLRDLLRKCEWPEPSYDSLCQICGGLMPFKDHSETGHKPGCALAEVLKEDVK